MSLEGKRVLVTGGSRGIGAAIVATLVRDGARVALHYGKSRAAAARLAEELDGAPVLLGADLADVGAGLALVARAEDALGGLDGVVNNAGMFASAPPTAPWADWVRVWQETLQVNLVAAADITRAALPTFQHQRRGTFVYIASRAAFRGDDPEYLAYAASKGGVVALTKSVARGYGRDGVAAMAVAPGFVATEMAQRVADEQGTSALVADIPLGEMAKPADVAAVVAFLLSDHARHLNGATVDINGGSYVR